MGWQTALPWVKVDIAPRKSRKKRKTKQKTSQKDPQKRKPIWRILIGLMVSVFVLLGVLGGLSNGRDEINPSNLVGIALVLFLTFVLVAAIIWYLLRGNDKVQAELAALKKSGTATQGRITDLKRVVQRAEDMPTTILYFIYFSYDTMDGQLIKKIRRQ
jgi:hypothetical protein